MSHALILIPAMLLDAALGEPNWLWSRIPHPAVVMGRCVNWLDQSLNKAPNQRLKGAVAVMGLAAGAILIGLGIRALGPLAEILVAAILLAQRSLVDHVAAVAEGLRASLAEGRVAVARIVSRDTKQMTEAQVARSAIESAAENLSDGVIAPLMWFLIAGTPGLLLYKVINTADSMIGYRTPKHEAFGWAAARFDDLLNLIPARVTGAAIAVLGQTLSDWPQIAEDARRHRSPNAGWPEAAMARHLDAALAGPRSYDGQMRDLAWVHAEGRREIGAPEIDAAVTMLWRVWQLSLVCVAAIGAALALT